ncbi:hypothetical protein E2C01_073069 [Portunus trituberculatus]|uniref:Uncharacterized protein n=1 Tax=Portunus trituberculatus TaxID=210409 RepID=A0A5B7I9L7_PORTR|nr:hypothetical protein [Portunus trituberculatus]
MTSRCIHLPAGNPGHFPEACHPRPRVAHPAVHRHGGKRDLRDGRLSRSSNARIHGGSGGTHSVKAEDDESLAVDSAGPPHLPTLRGGQENCALADQQHTKNGIHH